MQALLIFLLFIAAAILYGILHDQITARICLEYFTVYHPPIFGGLQDPTLLALGWGVIATWWVGAILGIPLALAARVGSMPRRSAASMIRPIAVLLGCMALCAATAGTAGWLHARAGGGPHPIGMPDDLRIRFVIDLWAHLASYASGFLGGCLLIVWTILARWRELVRRRLMPSPPPSAPAPSPAAES